MFTVGAIIEEGHICCDTTTLILEENSTMMVTSGALNVRTLKGRIRVKIFRFSGLFSCDCQQIVLVHTSRHSRFYCSIFCVVAISALIEKNFGIVIRFWIKKVVAFATELQSRHGSSR